MSAWREVFDGGSPEAEGREFEGLARGILELQRKNQQSGGCPSLRRTFHAKTVYGTAACRLRFESDLPDELRAGFAQPGAEYPAIVRFSNAEGVAGADYEKDLRGIAIRLLPEGFNPHDLLATNFPVSHARNAKQFVAFALATSGGPLAKLAGILGLVFKFGPFETLRMLKNVTKARRAIPSLALETYWSRGAIRWGEELAVRFLVRPASGASAAPAISRDPQLLSKELVNRLKLGEVRFDLCLQKFVDEQRTPIENTAVAWLDGDSPPIRVATLIISDSGSAETTDLAPGQPFEALSFNPWNAPDEFRPLGNLNRARKQVYQASSAERHGLP